MSVCVCKQEKTIFIGYIYIYIYVCVCVSVVLFRDHYQLLIVYQPITLMGRVFTNGLKDQGSIPGRVIPKTQKIVLDASLLNTQDYKVQIKSKVEESRERSNAIPISQCNSN